ncbi:MAG TPA: SDR family oxidoreductase [Thermohalobaculum sp.]|nr:SDR family oxidoreductase [Thermohalobaculum sp.]
MTRTVLITGGSRGIGRATAILAGRQGWRVGVNYVGNAEAAAETVRQVTAAGGKALAIPGDVSLEADVVAMFDATEAAFGRLTALVNNAGIVAPRAMLAEMTGERMRRLFDVNVLGAYLVAREGARRMPTDRGGQGGGLGGAIVNVSSKASVLGSPAEWVDYAGSKGAIDSLTIGLAKELAPGGVRVNAVRPGLIATDIHIAGGQPDRLERLAPSVPMGRAGTAEEVAETILWLLSDAASYVTGALIDVAGGR